MNKTELINKIAEKTDLTKKDSEKVLNAFIETVSEALKSTNNYSSLALAAFGLSKEQPEKAAIQKQARCLKLLLQTYRVLKLVKI